MYITRRGIIIPSTIDDEGGTQTVDDLWNLKSFGGSVGEKFTVGILVNCVKLIIDTTGLEEEDESCCNVLQKESCHFATIALVITLIVDRNYW